MTKIYLVTNCYGDPNKVYIGKSKMKYGREYAHQKTFGSQITYDYIDEIDSIFKHDWKPLECFWIEQFKTWGFEVLNINEGGGGPSFHSEETKQKLRKPKKEGTGDKIRKSHLGKKVPKLSKALKGKPKPWISIRNKGNKYALGHKLKIESIQIIKDKLKGRKDSNITIENKRKSASKFRKIIIQLDLDNNPIKEWESLMEIERNLKFNNGNISLCCQNKQKTAYGFKWKYK